MLLLLLIPLPLPLLIPIPPVLACRWNVVFAVVVIDADGGEDGLPCCGCRVDVERDDDVEEVDADADADRWKG